MPITSIGSYAPTTEQFESNWSQANQELSPNELKLAGDYTQAQFTQHRAELLIAIDAVTTEQAVLAIQDADRVSKRAALLERLRQFRGMTLALLGGTDYVARLPVLPTTNSNAAAFLKPLVEASAIWVQVNGTTVPGFTPPLLLQGGYTLAQFNTDIAALTTATENLERGQAGLGIQRTRRDNAMAAIYERMKQYRVLVPAMLPASSPARQNLPRLTPEPGATPPGLVVAGTWDTQVLEARLSWAAYAGEHGLKLQVRACLGSKWKDGEEVVVADLPLDAVSWSGDWGLDAPGAIATFKVFVMTTTGNENGGKSVQIVRLEV